MAFIPYLEKPEEWDLERIVRKRRKEQREREQKLLEKLDRKLFEKHITKHIPPDIREAIRQLREAGWLPAQLREAGKMPKELHDAGIAEQLREVGRIMRQQRQGVGWVREAFADVGFLIIFFVFVLIGSIYLGQKTMFYILSLLLLSIIVVNADKIKRLIEILT